MNENNKILVLKIDKNNDKFIWDDANKSWNKDNNFNADKNHWRRCTNLEQCLEKEDLTSDSSRSLIALTEAPTYNIIKWGSSIYESNGSIKTMIATGHHSAAVWKSMLFQLVYTCQYCRNIKFILSK